jgi:hypothetical protein
MRAPLALALGGAVLGAASTIAWIAGVLPHRGHHHDHFFTKEDLYAIDCRDLGRTLFAEARPAYLSQSIWYAYAGCQPVFAPAKKENPWEITIGNPYFDKPELKVLGGMVGDEVLPAICPRDAAAKRDPVCAWAAAHEKCEDLGTRLSRCMLTAADRAAIGG